MNNHLKPNSENNIRIILVDDDSDESYLFNEALEHSGLSITLINAHNGNQLYEYLESNSEPDLIFMDINMPYKDGLESLKEIRSNVAYKHLRIVMYSTTRVPANVNACYEAGADLFVIKPEDFDGMVKVVSKVCTTNWENFERPSVTKGFVVTTD